MRYEVTLELENTIVYNIEADSEEEAIQKVKDTDPLGHVLDSRIKSWSAIGEPNL